MRKESAIKLQQKVLNSKGSPTRQIISVRKAFQNQVFFYTRSDNPLAKIHLFCRQIYIKSQNVILIS